MKARAFRIVLALLIMLCMPGMARRVRAEATLVQQAQAADVMSELLTFNGEQMTAQRDAMREYMAQIGALGDYAAHRPAPARAPARAQPQEAPFSDVFKGAVLFVQQHGGNLADESLGKMKTPCTLR